MTKQTNTDNRTKWPRICEQCIDRIVFVSDQCESEKRNTLQQLNERQKSQHDAFLVLATMLCHFYSEFSRSKCSSFHKFQTEPTTERCVRTQMEIASLSRFNCKLIIHGIGPRCHCVSASHPSFACTNGTNKMIYYMQCGCSDSSISEICKEAINASELQLIWSTVTSGPFRNFSSSFFCVLFSPARTHSVQAAQGPYEFADLLVVLLLARVSLFRCISFCFYIRYRVQLLECK